MENIFNIALGIERMIALPYFAGKFEDFIPVQKGAKRSVRFGGFAPPRGISCSLTSPAFLLVSGPTDSVTLGFPCTCDRTLLAIAQACSIEAVMAWEPRADKPLPVMGYDFSSLREEIGKDVVDRIMESDFAWQKSRRQRNLHAEEHISFESLQQLIGDLEQHVIAYCKS